MLTTRRQIICYAEGDIYVTTCADDSELREQVEHIRTFHNENDKFLGVDPGFNEALKAALIAAGLDSFFHACDVEIWAPK